MGSTRTGAARPLPGRAHPAERIAAVRVRAPARLHFGFLDLNGGLGRRFGSIGLAVDTPAVQLKAAPAKRAATSGPEAERVRSYLLAAASHLGISDAVAIEVEEAEMEARRRTHPHGSDTLGRMRTAGQRTIL